MKDLSGIIGLPPVERAAAIIHAIPTLVDGDTADLSIAANPWARGGRAAALERLAMIDPIAYARTRNHVGGSVTRLSPWLRHGVLSLAEVRDAALSRVRRREDAAKLISELGWRDYWQQVYAAVGHRIRESLEAPVQESRAPPADAIPPDVLAARTGLACIDAFVKKLQITGWLHNHERMWLASWLVHVRGMRWQAGADWFLSHLLDGDPASNHLSWQWVAGTFSSKPYLFNRENLETFTGGSHCQPCGLRDACPVDGSYESLASRWLAAVGPSPRDRLRIGPQSASVTGSTAVSSRPLVWLTIDSAAMNSPAALAHPRSPRVYVIDSEWIAEERPSLKRLIFLFECLADIPDVEVRLGDPCDILPARARALGCDGLAVAETPCPRVHRVAATVHGTATGNATPLPVTTVPWPSFCDRSGVRDLGRFSRYWQQVAASAMEPTHLS